MMARRGRLRARARRLSPFAAGLAVVLGFAALRAGAPDPLDRLQAYAFDTLQRLSPRPDADAILPGSGVVVVDIDDASLARHGQWPWPRSRVAELVRTLQDAGAAAIGLDIVFSEPDRTSPARLAELWGREHGLGVTGGPAGAALPDYDRALAETIARGRVVTGFGLVPAGNGKKPVQASTVVRVGTEVPAGFQGFSGAVTNLPALDAAAAGQGSFMVATGERDDLIRRVPMLTTLEGRLLPALSLELLRVAAGAETAVMLRAERPDPAGPAIGYTVRAGDHRVPLALDGTLRLRHGRRRPEMTLPAATVLDPAESGRVRETVEGRIVLVGTSALGLSDLRPTPLNPYEPGVNIHAGAIEQIRTGLFLDRPAGLQECEGALAALLALLVAGLVTRGRPRGAALVAAASAAGAAGAAVWADAAGLLIDPVPLVLVPGSAFFAAVLARHLVAERDAQRLRLAFQQYLSPPLVESLAREPERLQLGGEEREMSFLFTDLEGFTSFAEAVAPSDLVATLNRYLDGVCGLAMEHGGTIDKIVGDAVHVMFNAPLDQPDHADRAVACALAIDAFARDFAAATARARADGRPFGTTRIGVNTGRAVVGNFGGERRFDYTAHGDAINTAARLEAINKRFGTTICVSRATVEGAGGAGRFRPIGAVTLKGKAQATELFTPVAAAAPEAAWHARYGEAFAALARGEPEGPALMLALAAAHPDDPLLAFHARRIARGEAGATIAAEAA
ncbi:CHASE2 domain-containing protein [Methylobacterium nigriterrae]|uniref:CHASE2 domain-containing protein n=1 Tax=Methylobacterium nigriterrae TaxID=3127512 RepID=UPI00301355E7